MRCHRRYGSEDEFSDDDSSSLACHVDSDSDSEGTSDSGSEREYQNSRTPPRGRSPSHRSSHLSGNYRDDSDEEDQVIRHSSGSSCICCESRSISSAPVNYGSFVRNSIPTPTELATSPHSDIAYYFAKPEGRNHFDHNNTMIRAPQYRRSDGSGREPWTMRRPIIGQYRESNPILRELERAYHMDRDLPGRYHYERRRVRYREEAERGGYGRRRERPRYRRNLSSDSRWDFRDQNYTEESRSSSGIAGWCASAFFAALSGG